MQTTKQIVVIWLLAIGLVVCTYGQDRASGSPDSQAPEQTYSTDPGIRDLNRSGEAAWLSGDIDRAIELFTQGTILAPKEPAFWANKTTALTKRAKTRYYNANQTSDDLARKQMLDAARSDLRSALETSMKFFNLMISSPEPANPALTDIYRFHKIHAYFLRAQANYLMTKLVDESYATNAVTAAEDFVTVETDTHRKILAQLDIGEMLIYVGKLREAFGAFQKVLLDDPSNENALLGAAVTLINLSVEANEKNSLDQGIEYLAQFVSKAGDKHPIRASAEEVLRYLKKEKVPFLRTGEPDSTVYATIDKGSVNGKAFNLTRPPYPAIAEFAHVHGRVPVRVLIDEDGNVEDAQAEGGHPLLQGAAVTAALTTKFSPTSQSGKSVKVRGIIIFEFSP